jgi:LuxR family maltose regulon positive regulatory protein
LHYAEVFAIPCQQKAEALNKSVKTPQNKSAPRCATRRYVNDFFPNVRPIAAMKTRVWVMQGRVGEALSWTRERGLSVDDDLTYLRDFEHITLARAKSDRAERSMLEAMELLERLLQAAEEGERTGSIIEILLLQALAHQVQGDIPAALIPLQQALMLAETEGYVRIFVDEGTPMAVLLARLHEHARKRPRAALTNVPLAYIERLLTLLRGERVRKVPSLLHPLHQLLPSRCSTR